tara:strand:- start:29 stop:301 length:273 start_codon:yes stop_codon:yes gene_type:complete
MARYTYNIDKTLYWEIEYSYNKKVKEVWSESNGDPGTPGYPAYIEVHAIYMPLKDENGNKVGVDIMPLLDQMDGGMDLDNIEDLILKTYE